MKIYMIGAGAMGGVYGGLLARAGYDVTLVDPREDHIRKIQSEGITIEGMRGKHVIKLPVLLRVIWPSFSPIRTQPGRPQRRPGSS